MGAGLAEAIRLDALELADLHVDALYHLDSLGLITASRDPAAAAPYFHLVRTPRGNRWLIGAHLQSPEREPVAAILSGLEPIADCAGARVHPPDVDAIRTALPQRPGSTGEYRGPAFCFPRLSLGADDGDLLTRPAVAQAGPFAWLRNAEDAAHPIAVIRADNGEIAAVCHSARSTSAAAEAGVETAVRHRRRGYAARAVVAWAAAVARSGRVPLYSTNWENVASRALARRLGLICYGEDLHIG